MTKGTTTSYVTPTSGSHDNVILMTLREIVDESSFQFSCWRCEKIHPILGAVAAPSNSADFIFFP